MSIAKLMLESSLSFFCSAIDKVQQLRCSKQLLQAPILAGCRLLCLRQRSLVIY